MTQDFDANKHGRLNARQTERIVRAANLLPSTFGASGIMKAFENLFGEETVTEQRHDTFCIEKHRTLPLWPQGQMLF